MKLSDIGITPEELQSRVVDKCVSTLLEKLDYSGDDGEEYAIPSPLQKVLNTRIKAAIESKLDAMFAAHVLPNVEGMVENLTLTETNRWGEKTGKTMTFIEYLISRAEAYITEQVDFNGKTKGEDSYGWRGSQTRIAHLIHQHLQYSIETAMKEAVKNANAAIVIGLQETVKIKLAEVANALKVEVKTK